MAPIFAIVKMSEGTDEFDYQGYLVFNGVYETALPKNSDLLGDLVDVESELMGKLGRFETGNQESDRGVEKLLLRDHFRDDDSVSGELEELTKRLIALRFIYEDRIEREGYIPGEDDLKLVEIPVIEDADIYWNYPHYMYFRGAKDDVAEAIDHTEAVFGSEVATDGGDNNSQSKTSISRFQQISFDSYFLTWMFYHHYNGNNPPNSAIEIDTLTDAAVTGDIDVWGGNNTVGDATQLVESPPLLSAILQNKSLQMIEGGFAVNDNTIQSEIQVGKVHIKSSVKSIKRANNTRRIALSLDFLNELVELQDHWKDLNPKEKYPPYDFFFDLYQTCDDHGMTLDNISETLRRDYCEKREDDESEWNL